MKRVLVVKENLKFNDKYNLPLSKRIIYKKSVTLIKDNKFLNKQFIQRLIDDGIQFEMLMEEWEVFNQDKIQVCTNMIGERISPVHTIVEPKDNGIKALFQQERMITVTINNFEDTSELVITKYKIDDDLRLKHYVLCKKIFISFDDKDIEKKWQNVLSEMKEGVKEIKERGYYYPIYSIIA